MVPLAEQRGLRFPDDYVIKMFFKEGLHRTPGRVLEAGCGNGNNLALFRGFGWDVTGVDRDPVALDNARHNFGPDPGATWIQADLGGGLPDTVLRQRFHAVLLPNVNCYLSRSEFDTLLAQCGDVLESGVFFLRARTPRDWRYGKGVQVESNGFVLSGSETGEAGLLNVFY
ncbi:MAG: class I SAM-dependent methyltransferase, partial [Acidobacteriota bacterium]|nr:class I SAM-dependent methyltransferase [Acidobacteriota bacterium]